jgi:hypothetical protein
MKTNILRMLAVLLCGFLLPSRKSRTGGNFLPTRSHRNLGRQEFARFIYW